MGNHSNKKVAANRGTSWHQNLRKGKFEARYNPTLLAVHRMKSDKNQDDIAKSLSLSAATYGAIERAKRPVSEKRAQTIAKQFGLSIGKLFVVTKKNKYLAATA